MRNLKHRPITIDEVVECLRRLSRELAEENAKDLRIGDMRPILLNVAVKLIRRLEFAANVMNEVEEDLG
jgi:hypothetical protein